MKHYKNRIADYRFRCGWTQQQLADELRNYEKEHDGLVNITKNRHSIYEWERKDWIINPKGETRIALLRIFSEKLGEEVKMDDLFYAA